MGLKATAKVSGQMVHFPPNRWIDAKIVGVVEAPDNIQPMGDDDFVMMVYEIVHPETQETVEFQELYTWKLSTKSKLGERAIELNGEIDFEGQVEYDLDDLFVGKTVRLKFRDELVKGNRGDTMTVSRVSGFMAKNDGDDVPI